MGRGLDEGPGAFAARLREAGSGRGHMVRDAATGVLRASHPVLEGLARALRQRPVGFDDHEAIFLAVGPETGVLLGAFVHRTVRGQAQGGVRSRPYRALEDWLRDGLRLSRAMSHKSALAGLWWGGGKGVIAQPEDPRAADPGFRRRLYGEYGAFVSGLRGAFVAAEDAGTTPGDVAAMFARSRFVTCVPPECGGSGNPAGATAQGVVSAMEAALDALGAAGLAGLRVAVQGCGQVGHRVVAGLLRAGAAQVVAADPDRTACEALAAAHPGARLDVRCVPAEDRSILYEDCDVLSPCALGGVLDPKSIPGVRARLVCGSANNQLEDDVRDDRSLAERGVVWVPDVLCSRMGIVRCANEQYGHVPDDPDVARHLDPAWPDSIPATTRRILARARDEGVPPGEAARREAGERMAESHPLFGHRGRRIIEGLVADRWHAQAPRAAC